MLTPFARRVISRIRCLKRSKAFGAMVRLISGPSLKLNPRNFRCCGRATALFASFTLSLSFFVMNRFTLLSLVVHPFAANADVAVVRVSNKAKTTALQLRVEFVEHEMAEQRRKC